MTPLKQGRYKAVAGYYYKTPKEIWGFRARAARGRPANRARDFLKANRELFGLAGVSSRIKLQRTIEKSGARHLIFQQSHLGLRIHRAYVTVHMDLETGFIWRRTAPSLPNSCRRNRIRRKANSC
jgi:hypothetical protein